VQGDAKRLVQVVANLLNNAAKYTPAGGLIDVQVTPSDDEVVVHVKDNGIGISKEAQLRVFDLFEQVDRTTEPAQGGLGLGLALVKSLVELHHGTVVCSSDGAGMGSRFTVTLPRLKYDHASERPAADHMGSSGNTGRRTFSNFSLP